MRRAIRNLLLFGGFRPENLPGFLDDWDYRFGVVTSGAGSVDSHTSKRGRVVGQIADERPTLTPTGIVYDGFDDYLTGSDGFEAFVVPELSVFAVGKTDRSGLQGWVGARHVQDLPNSTVRRFFGFATTPVLDRIIAQDTAIGANVIASVSDTTTMPVIIYGDRTLSALRVGVNNGALSVQSGSLGTPVSFSVMRFGASAATASASEFMLGEISRVLFFNRVLTAGERAQVFRYLSMEHGIALVG